MGFRSNLSVVRASGDWKLKFQSKIWNPAYRSFVQGLRISVVKTFWAGFHVVNLWIGSVVCWSLPSMGSILDTGRSHTRFFEVWRIDIFGAGRIRPGFFFVEVVDTNYWRHGYCLGLVVVRVDWKWSRRGSRRGGRVTKRQMFFFFVSDEADRYFVSSPLEWGFKVVIGEDILKQGFGD